MPQRALKKNDCHWKKKKEAFLRKLKLRVSDDDLLFLLGLFHRGLFLLYQ